MNKFDVVETPDGLGIILAFAGDNPVVAPVPIVARVYEPADVKPATWKSITLIEGGKRP